jgi:3-oxoacid CoA-transferase subunit B
MSRGADYGRGWTKEEMLQEVIALFTDGCSVNLGIGLPTAIAEMLPQDLDVFIQSENGVLGVAGRPTKDTVSPTLINAGKETITIRPGASFFDSGLSFGMIRGGHIDFCVLGGMEVDSEGSLANWIVPGQKITGMGGAMDLVHGARQVIVVMTHFNKVGEPKLKEICTLPLTGKHVVDLVLTELGIFAPKNGRFHVRKLAPGVSFEDLKIPMSLIKAKEVLA